MTSLSFPLRALPITTPAAAFTSAAIDAAGEYVDLIGYMYWDGEPASAKTVSSSGGSISARFGTVTFANAGTTLRIGIQDVDATNGPPARGDGTHDVYAELVGGTDTITANAARETAMETNTKDISHGQLICIRLELTARAGADTIQVSGFSSVNVSYPATTHNSGAVALVAAIPSVIVVADDGTVGWLAGGAFVDSITTRAFDSGTATADEYASLVQFPVEVAICGIVFYGRWSASGGTCKAILYSAPLTSPVAERETTIDTNQIANTSSIVEHYIMFSSAYTVPANTKIALSLQPQDTSGDVVAHEWGLGSTVTGRAKPWRVFGGTWSKGTRLDATGALTEDTDAVMSIGALINAITVSGGVIGGPNKRAGMQ